MCYFQRFIVTSCSTCQFRSCSHSARKATATSTCARSNQWHTPVFTKLSFKGRTVQAGKRTTCVAITMITCSRPPSKAHYSWDAAITLFAHLHSRSLTSTSHWSFTIFNKAWSTMIRREQVKQGPAGICCHLVPFERISPSLSLHQYRIIRAHACINIADTPPLLISVLIVFALLFYCTSSLQE